MKVSGTLVHEKGDYDGPSCWKLEREVVQDDFKGTLSFYLDEIWQKFEGKEVTIEIYPYHTP